MSAATQVVASRRPDPASVAALRVADFLVKTEIERTRLFRAHLQATVCKVSPLLVELAVLEGLSLSEAFARMQPPQDWPWRPVEAFSRGLFRRSYRVKGLPGSDVRREGARFRQAFRAPGVVIRDVGHPRGQLGVRPFEGVLGFAAALGPCLLSSLGSTAELKLPGPLPETLTMSLPGRRLGQIVDHPLFADNEYRIVRVQPDLSDGAPVLTFRVPLVPFELAASGRWAELFQ